ncbi:putative kinase binding protein cgi-121 protein [Rosellinia necatrix]|uniref:EKC/KEOPS complex subunit CGI121 n=1 Tax=Rosellinia necatrix TaxID=77044 RepID=A0A1W2TC00_ROSNE|nr:putative kinase binding protein cgi-121 protein [Rosellinia necatrix]
MGSGITQPVERPSTQGSQLTTEAELRPSPTAKRQKIEHPPTGPAMAAGDSPAPILESLHLDHTPDTHSVHVAVFRDVENADFLHRQLLARDAAFEYALIDAGAITSRVQVLSAAFKAIAAQVAGTLKTPNVHSELVCSLSPTTNISETYRRHGITPTSRHLVIVKVLVTPLAAASATGVEAPLSAQDVQGHLHAHVRGKPVPFTDEVISQLTDWARVRKYYKLNGVGWLDEIKDPAAKNREMSMLVMTGMALRGV